MPLPLSEAAEFERLSALVLAYEAHHDPTPPGNPETMRAFMRDQGMDLK